MKKVTLKFYSKVQHFSKVKMLEKNNTYNNFKKTEKTDDENILNF